MAKLEAIYKAVKIINPNAQMSISENDLDTIVWENGTPPISKTKIKMSNKQPKFVIILGNFYSQESAKLLIKRVKTESLSLRNKKISIDKKNKHNFEVFLGPYKTIKMIKNDYIALKQINFDEVDIKIHE